MTTCSTVSGVLMHVAHMDVMDRLRLCNDWLRRARLKRRRDTIDDVLGWSMCRYDGMDVSVHMVLLM